ncbi:hypothetical protein PM8797T_27659 [Gimesia maris DSM 8797]|nr:hypothetical protein PM8797T_27659 [Gimesia maris DSM 8797]
MRLSKVQASAIGTSLLRTMTQLRVLPANPDRFSDVFK